MESKKFKDTEVGQWVVKNVPSVIGALEGFAPAPIKGCLDLLKNAINSEPTLTPEQKAEGLKLVNEHELEMLKEHDAQATVEIDADQKDASDARNREIQIANSDKAPMINKIMTPILALLITVAFFGLLAYLCKYPVPPENKDILNIMLGSLGTAWVGVVGYYFHTSLSSSKKDDMISKMVNNQ